MSFDYQPTNLYMMTVKRHHFYCPKLGPSIAFGELLLMLSDIVLFKSALPISLVRSLQPARSGVITTQRTVSNAISYPFQFSSTWGVLLLKLFVLKKKPTQIHRSYQHMYDRQRPTNECIMVAPPTS